MESADGDGVLERRERQADFEEENSIGHSTHCVHHERSASRVNDTANGVISQAAIDPGGVGGGACS